jgi:hypothetical protein
LNDYNYLLLTLPSSTELSMAISLLKDERCCWGDIVVWKELHIKRPSLISSDGCVPCENEERQFFVTADGGGGGFGHGTDVILRGFLPGRFHFRRQSHLHHHHRPTRHFRLFLCTEFLFSNNFRPHYYLCTAPQSHFSPPPK